MKTKNRWLLAAVLLGVMLTLTACGADNNQGQQSAELDKPIMTLAEYPLVDGSTANLPMMAQIMADVTGISLEEAEQQDPGGLAGAGQWGK